MRAAGHLRAMIAADILWIAGAEAIESETCLLYTSVLGDWARLAGVEMNFPSRWHPAKSVAAMRFATALEPDQPALIAFARAAFESYFGAQDNLDDPAVLEAAATRAGLDGAAIRHAAASDAVKARLRANTDEVIARGGYGSPSMFVDGDDMYFGNDQLPLVEAALLKA